GDALAVGDGLEFETAASLCFGRYDAERGRLVLERDRFSRGEEVRFHVGETYCIDRRPLGIRGRMHDAVRAGFADELVRSVLEGDHEIVRNARRHALALDFLGETGLNPAQIEAGAAAIADERLCLVQGPPGTGKTRLLAEVVKGLCARGTRVALVAFTHRAVDNALCAIRALDDELPLFKLGYPDAANAELRAARVSMTSRASGLPEQGIVVGGTCFAAAKIAAEQRFHVAVFDEAGQMPTAHAIAGMLLARHFVLFGDHRQLPPVITAEHADPEVTESVFERLHRLYGGHLLDTTYRMNDGVCDVVSRAFYGGRLHPAETAASRRVPFVPGGRFDEILDPERPAVFARVDHSQPGMRSLEEAALTADLCEELVVRHGVPIREIAVIAPFRAQVRAIRSAVQRRTRLPVDQLVVDTVERIQGQEREAVVVSLAVGDPETLDQRAAFFFSTNRLNVALSRARTKAILVASSLAFRALPLDADSLRAVAVFQGIVESLPTVDMTSSYAERCEPDPA
ncbi:MAG: AAA family ATPase, partial [Planctomycetes bacterium]|nr:AAA family ATPase [Planctomycetota bacterium]